MNLFTLKADERYNSFFSLLLQLHAQTCHGHFSPSRVAYTLYTELAVRQREQGSEYRSAEGEKGIMTKRSNNRKKKQKRGKQLKSKA